jgi:hypothetical protein
VCLLLHIVAPGQRQALWRQRKAQPGVGEGQGTVGKASGAQVAGDGVEGQAVRLDLQQASSKSSW